MTPYESTNELLDAVTSMSGLQEAAKVTVVRGYRKHQGKVEKEVTISIEDRGELAGALRWAVVAEDEDGRQATGNPATELRTALATVHWGELDRASVD